MKGKDQDKELAEAIGKRIMELRKANRLSQVNLAQRVGIRQAPLSNIEQGKCLPSTPVLIGIAQALGASVDTLLGMSNSEADTRPNDALICVCGDESTREVAMKIMASSGDLPITAMSFDLTPGVAEDVATALRRALGIEHVVRFDLSEHLAWEGIAVGEAAMSSSFAVWTNASVSKATVLFQADLNESAKQYCAANALARIAIALRDSMMHEKIETLQATKERVSSAIALAFLLPNVLISRYVMRHGMPSESNFQQMAEFFGIEADRLRTRLAQVGLI